MKDVSLFRLYLLRALYLLVVVGLGLTLWPDVLNNRESWGLNRGLVACMLAAFSITCLLGLRYPLQMLPVLLWEAIWKSMWLALVGIPAALRGPMGAGMADTLFAVGMVVLVFIAVPWDHVWRHYVLKTGERWGTKAKVASGTATS